MGSVLFAADPCFSQDTTLGAALQSSEVDNEKACGHVVNFENAILRLLFMCCGAQLRDESNLCMGCPESNFRWPLNDLRLSAGACKAGDGALL